jgi:spore coat polysaccharide biosynthesis predicted glycosyltransferase SpsG
LALAEVTQCGWLVLDGYHFDEDFQRGIKDGGFKLLSLDDYGHCKHWPADIVLNQNLHAPRRRAVYERNSPNCVFLLGPDYALLRREFRLRGLPPNRSVAAGERVQLLVTMGGVDHDNWTGRILGQLAASEIEAEVTAVVGGGNPNIEQLRGMASPDSGIRIVQDAQDMASLYLGCDAVISGAGSTCYEWLRYRRPALAFVVADNQAPLGPYLAEIPGVEVFGLGHGFVADEDIRRGIEQLLARAHGETPVPLVVDAHGADRIVDRILTS